MTFLQTKIRSTTTIVTNLEYFDTPEAFFTGFKKAFENVKSQILKLETKQTYDESGNKSFDLWQAGRVKESIEILPEEKAGEISLYEDQAKRNIEFIRCRPISIPFSNYLNWEIHNYDFNSSHGENIYFLNLKSNNDLFEVACHDFMIFDSTLAFIHNYDEKGLIQGGWVTKDQDIIDELTCIFALIRSRSINYKKFLSDLGKI